MLNSGPDSNTQKKNVIKAGQRRRDLQQITALPHSFFLFFFKYKKKRKKKKTKSKWKLLTVSRRQSSQETKRGNLNFIVLDYSCDHHQTAATSPSCPSAVFTVGSGNKPEKKCANNPSPSRSSCRHFTRRSTSTLTNFFSFKFYSAPI